MSKTKTKEFNQEDWERDLERRKMLIVFSLISWNMAFFVFVLLPLVSIYKMGNPHWLALINAIFSISAGYIFWKKQKLNIHENAKNDNEEEKVETV